MTIRALFSWLTGLTVVFATALVRAESSTIDLTPRIESNDLVQVSIGLEGGGNDVVRAEGPDAATGGQEQKLPMSVTAAQRYDERRVASPDNSVLAVRYYHLAGAVIKVDPSGVTPQLSDDHRLIVVQKGDPRPIMYCPNSPLPREQLDLVDVVGNPTVINQLLPSKPVAVGDTWNQDATVMAGVLALDSIAACEVQSVLDEANGSFAKVRVAGVVNGTADGAATQQEVRGVYLFDRRLQRITRLNLAIRERRSIGGATPGVEAVAKVQMTIDPIKSSTKLTDEAVAKVVAADRTAKLDLLYEAQSMGFRTRHDRQWFVTSQQRETVTLRRVDRGDLVAQCIVTALPAKSAGRQSSLDQFQRDITLSLGKSFEELVSSRQWTNAGGLHCYEVVVRGKADDIPVEWHYYLVAPESGPRVSLAFTIEGTLLNRVGQADRAMVDSIELFPPTLPDAEAPATPAPPQTAAKTADQTAK